ncbi:protein scabrous [Danaus plexippus]|uniref:Scabrous protein n=1 Tax=Danaus plexippus plexippus TaxID=278856 RepID=A0A212F9J7_DANPL|nr:protein scabrous [Danaus plexippus]OWR50412.1 putative scabrous protein [Danaus plexippus plexippus]
MEFVKLWALIICLCSVNAREIDIKNELLSLTEQFKALKTVHLADVSRLKEEIKELKKHAANTFTENYTRNEQATLQWAKSSMRELRIEMRELSQSINSSVLLRQLQNIRNELKRALSENTDLAQLARTQEARVDKLDSEVGRLKYDSQEIRGMVAEIRSQVAKLSKEIKLKTLNEDSFNDVLEPYEKHASDSHPKHGHKIRHNKMVHAQISRLARSQNQLDEYQQHLQTQLLDVLRRLDRIEEANWNLVSTRVDYLATETNTIKNELNNVTQRVADFDKVHASMLELREDVESIENKADKTIPEFRKEISKLDLSFAQLNAQSSYLKEDQENLRQSVKAIAVSVSNTIDRAEMDRLVIKALNDSVIGLENISKQHYYRLNDHILKSEANKTTMISQYIPLPELIDEVKELQPLEREYENLVVQLPKDCSSVTGPDQVYLINPGHSPIETFCTNGSTLIQRRYNGSVEFNRKFAQYVQGFGNAASEFWLGLESMHQLTADNCSSMRIEMTDIYGSSWHAEYDHFSVGSADTGYVLTVSGFRGNASDAFEYQNHMEFSAIDHDRDISNTHCAANYEGGWWFSHCQHVNINGKYTLGLTWFDSLRNEWIAVATSEMRLFRNKRCT